MSAPDRSAANAPLYEGERYEVYIDVRHHLQPSIWMDCGGPDVGRVKNCRTMLGARIGAALRNLAMWRAE